MAVDVGPGDPDYLRLVGPNQWPTALPELRDIHACTRLSNPTTAVAEERIASLEGGAAAVAVASGQAATALALLNLARTGDHIVASSSLYGGTRTLLEHTFADFGIKVTFIDDPDDLEAWASAIRPATKVLFGESIGNPRGNVLDIDAIARIAHEAGVPLVIDNTVLTPYAMPGPYPGSRSARSGSAGEKCRLRKTWPATPSAMSFSEQRAVAVSTAAPAAPANSL